MKIGLFGGTFDPIHWGHLRSAEEVREAFSLDRLLFIPSSQPPHKRGQTGALARDRYEVVRLAIVKNSGFALSNVETSRPGRSYSIDTIRYFAQTKSRKDSLYLILGLDAFREIGSWKEFKEIFPLCHLIVTSRPGRNNSMSMSRMPVAVRRLFCYDSDRKIYRHQNGNFLYFFRVTDIAISASEIRERLRKGSSVRYLVPLKVETYIKKRGMYRGAQEGR